jgi:UDP-3-O-[3-hydroxymyristoyl] glucosamine N-acyltransferase
MTNSSAMSAPETSETLLSQVYRVPATALQFVENNPRETLEWTAVLAVVAASIYYGRPDYSKAIIPELKTAAMPRMPDAIMNVEAKVEAAASSRIEALPNLVLVAQDSVSGKDAQSISLQSLGIVEEPFVDPFALIGKNVKLGKYVQIEFSSRVGEGSVLADGAILERGVQVGKNVKIMGRLENGFSGALIGPESSIGDNVIISPGVHIGARVKIQSGVVIGPNTSIQDDVVIHQDVNIGGGALIRDHTIVRERSNICDRAYLGNYSTTGRDVTIGPNVFIRDKISRPTGEVFRQVSIGDRTVIGTDARILKSVSQDLKIAPKTIVN